jgi:hypothetical protein
MFKKFSAVYGSNFAVEWYKRHSYINAKCRIFF